MEAFVGLLDLIRAAPTASNFSAFLVSCWKLSGQALQLSLPRPSVSLFLHRLNVHGRLMDVSIC